MPQGVEVTSDEDLDAFVDVFRTLMRWDDEAKARGQRDEIRTGAMHPMAEVG